jgi:hypothetical protein
MNLNMRAAAILVWLSEGENAGLDSFSPQMVIPTPSPNPEVVVPRRCHPIRERR